MGLIEEILEKLWGFNFWILPRNEIMEQKHMNPNSRTKPVSRDATTHGSWFPHCRHKGTSLNQGDFLESMGSMDTFSHMSPISVDSTPL